MLCILLLPGQIDGSLQIRIIRLDYTFHALSLLNLYKQHRNLCYTMPRKCSIFECYNSKPYNIFMFYLQYTIVNLKGSARNPFQVVKLSKFLKAPFVILVNCSACQQRDRKLFCFNINAPPAAQVIWDGESSAKLMGSPGKLNNLSEAGPCFVVLLVVSICDTKRNRVKLFFVCVCFLTIMIQHKSKQKS